MIVYERRCGNSDCTNKFLCTGGCDCPKIEVRFACFCKECLLKVQYQTPFEFRRSNSYGEVYPGFEHVTTLQEVFDICYPDENHEFYGPIIIAYKMLD